MMYKNGPSPPRHRLPRSRLDRDAVSDSAPVGAPSPGVPVASCAHARFRAHDIGRRIPLGKRISEQAGGPAFGRPRGRRSLAGPYPVDALVASSRRRRDLLGPAYEDLFPRRPGALDRSTSPRHEGRLQRASVRSGVARFPSAVACVWNPHRAFRARDPPGSQRRARDSALLGYRAGAIAPSSREVVRGRPPAYRYVPALLWVHRDLPDRGTCGPIFPLARAPRLEWAGPGHRTRVRPRGCRLQSPGRSVSRALVPAPCFPASDALDLARSGNRATPGAHRGGVLAHWVWPAKRMATVSSDLVRLSRGGGTGEPANGALPAASGRARYGELAPSGCACARDAHRGNDRTTARV